MSLRDDLDYIDAKTIKVVDAVQWNAALDRLRAALTPAALVWLEALPQLLEVEAKLLPGKWACATVGKTSVHFGTAGSSVEFRYCVPPGEGPINDRDRLHCAFIRDVRNALHAAAKAQECGDKEDHNA